MSTIATNGLQPMIESLRNACSAAMQSASTVDFEQFERQLNQLDTACREVQQAMWAAEARTTIEHLESGGPLTPADQEVIRTFLISDAEHYLAMENNYSEWLREMQRLLNDLAARAGHVDRRSIAEIRGVIKDALRLAPSIRNYLEERHRIQRCTTALDSLDRRSRELLARILKDDLESCSR